MYVYGIVPLQIMNIVNDNRLYRMGASKPVYLNVLNLEETAKQLGTLNGYFIHRARKISTLFMTTQCKLSAFRVYSLGS